ncbi:MAG: hypothetical protein KGO50_02715 [Myxococcales bacterium]|nr:hypothetical protein [Myxococcales bacterium]
MKPSHRFLSVLIPSLLSPLTFIACGGDDTEVSDDAADAGLRPEVGRTDSGNNSTDDGGVDNDAGGSPDDANEPGDATPDGETTDATSDGSTTTDTSGSDDVRPDTGPVVDPRCDRDGDGFVAVGLTCNGLVGDDCDDTLRAVNPGAREACDFLDNNCNGSVNEGVDCYIFAHESDAVYRVDPFSGEPPILYAESSVTLLDFDTAPDGTLYGITSTSLVRYDDPSWVTVGSHGIGASANGMAILNPDIGYVTASNQTYEIDLSSGMARSIGSMDYTSSGDCVINKDGTLFMSARAAGPSGTDQLVVIDASPDGGGAATLIGQIGFVGVYGLTFAYGYLFGFTSNGEVIEINPITGAGREVANVDKVFFGAASSPSR